MEENQALVQKFLMIERAIVELFDTVMRAATVTRYSVPDPTKGFRIDIEDMRDDIKRMENTSEL